MQHDMNSKDPSVGPEGAVADLRVRTVVGIFDRPAEAEETYRALQGAGIAADDISLIQRGDGARPELGVEQTHTGRTTAAGVSAGAIIGGIVGLVALTIPGIGPLLAVGPITFALTGAGVGAALGGLVGSITGLGVPTEQAKAYEQAVRQGGTLLAVRTSDKAAADRVAAILRDHGAQQTADFAAAI